MEHRTTATNVSPWPPDLIDFDHLIGMGEAAKLIRRWLCRPTSPSTVFRWCQSGRQGVVLPHVRLGRHLRTTEPAIRWWFEAVTARQLRSQAEVPAGRPPLDAQELHRQLEEEGL